MYSIFPFFFFFILVKPRTQDFYVLRLSARSVWCNRSTVTSLEELHRNYCFCYSNCGEGEGKKCISSKKNVFLVESKRKHEMSTFCFWFFSLSFFLFSIKKKIRKSRIKGCSFEDISFFFFFSILISHISRFKHRLSSKLPVIWIGPLENLYWQLFYLWSK